MSAYEGLEALRVRLADEARKRWADPGTRPVKVMTVLCLAVGFWLRARGFLYDVPSFWLDECSWAMMLEELPLTELLIRPPGFMVVSRVMATLFGPTETPLRTLSWLAGVGTLAMAPSLAHRLFRADAARLLFVGLLALHPAATDLAKEFKPYSVSLALHVGLMLLTLRSLDSGKSRDLHWLLGFAVVGTLFAQDVIFSFPGVFALVGYSALRSDRKKLAPIVVAAGLIVALLLAQYFFIWRNLPKEEAAYWAEKYKVFYSKESGVSFAEWFLRRYERMASFPGYHGAFWKPAWLSSAQRAELRAIGNDVWFVLHVIGVVAMFWRKKHREAALLFLPLAVLFVFNQAGFWPFGVFRTNAFLIANTAGLTAMAFDESSPRRRPFRAIVPTTLLLFVPYLFEGSWPPETKRSFTRVSEYPGVLEWLAENAPEPPAERRTLVLARECEAWRYFLKYHPRTKPLRSRLEAGFDVHCIENADEVSPTINRLTTSPTRPTWLVREYKQPRGLDRDITRVELFSNGTNAVSEYVRLPPEADLPTTEAAE